MHEDGASLQQVVNFLAEHGVTLSKVSVKRHFDTHFAPKEEAAKRYYEESQQAMDTAVDKRVEQLHMLDEMIARNYRLHVGASNWAEEQMSKGGIFMDAKPMVDLLTGTASEFRQALKLRADLLGESQDDSVKVMFVNEPTDDD
ncbi:hypothetical protein [Alicyclobacillus fastidiosus]|uniref:Terminase small subunit n=1 Tax=Alicyclobacillus fastidiosus TaxID=392011 RepID=A0ABV5AK73_9BACL|nr:hypothetical protein [Alicyclobacillus fastidiosus]WEH09278.1 hypothetical protein PYS47_21820 [Alicyclobacillus fastidiosus]